MAWRCGLSDDLDRDVPLQRRVIGFVDVAGRARADLSHDSIFPDPFQERRDDSIRIAAPQAFGTAGATNMVSRFVSRLAGSRIALLALALAVSMSSPSVPQTPSPLDDGLRLYNEGDLGAAVLAFDSAIQALAASDQAAPDLVKAYVYQGATYVGLGQEDLAKASFRKASVLDPKLRLRNSEFPDRVVRVFDAARTGKTKSVMKRPSDVPKRAGISALGVAGIVVGSLAVSGAAVAVATSGGDDKTTTFPEGFSISFVSSTPPPGSTIRVGKGPDPRVLALSMTFTLRASAAAAGEFRSDLFLDQRDCASGALVPFSIAAGSTLTITVPFAIYLPDPACVLPVTTNRLAMQLLGATYSSGIEGISYSLVE